MKILNEFVPEAYEVSKKVFEKQISHTEGVNILSSAGKMNKNSASDYINNFKCMMVGKKFTRTNNTFSMKYFFDKISNEYDTNVLQNAVTALKLHIEYYEDLQKTNMRSMREILNAYKINNESADEIEQTEIIKTIQKDKKSKHQLLLELLEIKDSEPEYILINHKAYKRDNVTIAKIKVLRDFRCQLCSTIILKKDGSFYIEAAHIKAKSEKGSETLNNIILLCPNHHKEFDLGNKIVKNHTDKKIEFSLNDKSYSINFELIN